MKPHKKQTLFGFVGIVIVVFVFKMAGDYIYVTKREAEYKKHPCTRKYERVVRLEQNKRFVALWLLG